MCEKLKVNIERAEASGTDGPLGYILLQVAVRDLNELSTVMRNIGNIPEVERVERVRG